MKDKLLKHRQIFYFILAGGLSAIIEVTTFKIFSVELPKYISIERNFHGIHYLFSNILSTTIAIISNYFFSIWFVFKQGKHSKRKEFVYFISVSFFTTLLSLGVFQLFYNTIYNNESIDLGIYIFSSEILSKISAIILVSMLNYSIKKRVIFNG